MKPTRTIFVFSKCPIVLDQEVNLILYSHKLSQFGLKALDLIHLLNLHHTGSPAELCGLLMGDEIVALGGCRVAEMNYEQFKGSMDSAQQKGTLLMDIRRHGQNGEVVETVCKFVTQPSLFKQSIISPA